MQADEFALLPPLRGGDMGWEYVGRRGGAAAFGAGGSALLGEYRPPEPIARPVEQQQPAAPAPAAAPAAAAAAAAAAGPKKLSKPLSAEDVASKTASFLREYVSVGDGKEAALCLRELRDAPKAEGVADLRGVVEASVTELFDATVRGASRWRRGAVAAGTPVPTWLQLCA
jgi:hypothetical protein